MRRRCRNREIERRERRRKTIKRSVRVTLFPNHSLSLTLEPYPTEMFVVVHTLNPLNCPVRSFREPTVWSKDSGPVTPCWMSKVDSMAQKKKQMQNVEKTCLRNVSQTKQWQEMFCWYWTRYLIYIFEASVTMIHWTDVNRTHTCVVNATCLMARFIAVPL